MFDHRSRETRINNLPQKSYAVLRNPAKIFQLFKTGYFFQQPSSSDLPWSIVWSILSRFLPSDQILSSTLLILILLGLLCVFVYVYDGGWRLEDKSKRSGAGWSLSTPSPRRSRRRTTTIAAFPSPYKVPANVFSEKEWKKKKRNIL